jgi:hypothetical protein
VSDPRPAERRRVASSVSSALSGAWRVQKIAGQLQAVGLGVVAQRQARGRSPPSLVAAFSLVALMAAASASCERVLMLRAPVIRG